jgi:hypothetical protein
MKRVLILSVLVLVGLSSCKFIKTKILSKKVDTLSAFVDTMNQVQSLDSSDYKSMLTEVQEESQAALNAAKRGSPSGDFFMIVGCFMVPENATRYAEKIKGMGYEGAIITGKGGLQMVTAKSYDKFSTSVADIGQFRTDVTPNAWVYVQK